MKNLVPLFIMMMSFSFLIAQERVELSEIKIKSRKVVWYKTYLRKHYWNDDFYYLNGKKYNGIIFENWENGNLKREFEVKNGKEDGFRKTFYANGDVDEDFPGKNKVKASGYHYVHYDNNGIKKYELRVSPIDKDGNSFDTVTWYYSNGQINYIRKKKNGLWHGIQYVYYDNGQIQSKAPRKDGMPHGTVYQYDNTGVLRSQTSYQDGEKHGMEFHYPRWGKTTTTRWINGRNTSRYSAN